MYMSILFKISVFFCLFFSIVTPVATAQQFSDSTGDMTSQLICSENVNIKDVQFSVNLSEADISSTSPAVVTGTFNNDTNVPLIVREVRAVVMNKEGVIVDQHIVDSSIEISPKQAHQFVDRWFLPQKISSGEYFVEYSAVFGNVPLLTARTGTFTITGEESAVTFDIDATTINGTPLKIFRVDTFSLDASTELSVVLSNPTNKEKSVPFQWNQYTDLVAREDGRVNGKTTLVLIPANSRVIVPIAISPLNKSHSLVTVLVDDQGTKSMISIPFMAKESKPELVLAGVAPIPLYANQSNDWFYCVNAGNQNLAAYELHLKALDQSGVVLADTRIIDITNPESANFSLNSNVNNLTVVSELSTQGVPVALSEDVYLCSNFNDIQCYQTSVSSDVLYRLYQIALYMVPVLIIIFGLIVVIVIRTKTKMRNKNSSVETNT